MTQLFGFAVAAAIRATLLLLGAAGMAVLLRKRGAALQHALWTGAMAASLAVPVLIATLPDLGVRNPVSVSELASATWTKIAGLAARSGDTGARASHAAASTNPRAVRSVFDIGAIFTSQAPTSRSLDRIKGVLVLIWLMGVALGLSRIVRSSLAVLRLRRSAEKVTDDRITSIWKQVQRASASRQILLVEADGVTAPGTAGFIRPTIFLPRGAAEWGSVRIRATLAHEYAHIIRRDCLTQLVADLAVALYWFNPLVWYARRRMTTERERACDDLVLRTGVRPERYAAMLVETVRTSLLQRKESVAGVLSMARPSELETRLVSILDLDRSRRRMSSLATSVTVSAVTAAAFLISASHLDAATEPEIGSRLVTAQSRAQLPSLRSSVGEPDRRGDSIAGPLSERVALDGKIWSAARNTVALRGPDSVLARKLYAQLSKSPSWEGDLVRDRSAWALSRQRGGLLVEPLIESLSDRDWRIRAYAAWALAYSGASRAVPALLGLLNDPNWRVRAMAAQALDGIGDESAATGMAARVDDEAWQVRMTAVQFIGALQNAKYQSLLETALADRHIAVRHAAAEALGKPSP